MSVSVTVTGISELKRQLESLARDFPYAIGGALLVEAEIEMTEAKQRTPVQYGDLRRSGHVVGPTGRGMETRVSLLFGGPAAPYALFVHEDMEAFHKVGQAKFLESTLLESARSMPSRIAKRLGRSIGSRRSGGS